MLSLGLLNNNMETIATIDTSDPHINHWQPPGKIETKWLYIWEAMTWWWTEDLNKKIKIRGRQTGADSVC